LPVGPVRAEAERTLLEHAGTYHPVVLGRLARRIAAHADPGRDAAADAAALAAAEARAARRVELSLSRTAKAGRGCGAGSTPRAPPFCAPLSGADRPRSPRGGARIPE
jgi:hypothetical protein